jgi:hypothetical protein
MNINNRLTEKETTMNKMRRTICKRWCWQVFALALCTCFAASPVLSAEGIDPEADRILKSMSTYLGGIKAFRVNADVDLEVVTKTGQKVQFSSMVKVAMKRPAGFHITRKGMLADAEFIFDGKALTLYGKNLNIYTQTVVPGTNDDAIMAYEYETGLSAPGADLLLADPYAILSYGIESGIYVGVAYVNGVECHHLAFREASVDWQLWVSTGDKPLPMKYVITSKWQTAAPQYEFRLRDWDTSPKIKKKEFSFSAPKGAKSLESMSTNEMGEFTSAEEDQ